VAITLRPEMWGITMEQIKSIMEHPMYDTTMTMYDVVNKIVKPKTAGTGMGYALYCNQEVPIRARVMVSHGKLNKPNESKCVDGYFCTHRTYLVYCEKY